MRISRHLVVAMLAIVSFACEHRFTSLEEYEKFVRSNDSPYMSQVVRNGIKVTVRYIPTDEMLIQNYRQLEQLKKSVKTDSSASPVSVEEAIREAEDELSEARALYDNSLYFAVTFGYDDGKRDVEYEQLKRGFQVYSEWTQKLQFRMYEYITLESPDAGAVSLSLYRLERSFGITKDRVFLLAFPETFNRVHLRQSGVTLHIAEFGLDTGNLSFTIDTKNTVNLVLSALDYSRSWHSGIDIYHDSKKTI